MADNRRAYGLAKEAGIDTKGMTPHEVWEALKKRGIAQDSDNEFKAKSPDSEERNNFVKKMSSLAKKSVDELKTEVSENLPKEENTVVEPSYPFPGGILARKEYVEEYSFRDSKFKDEEADVYHLKDGTNIVFQSMGDPYYQKITPQQAIRVWNKVPDFLKRFSQKTIEFVDYYNPEDPYWATIYTNFTHAYATSGDTISFYRNEHCLNNDSQVFSALCHEIGHNFARQLFPAESYTEWDSIIQKDGGKRVSQYAKNHLREDFADSIALYCENPLDFQKKFPNRFVFLEKWLKKSI